MKSVILAWVVLSLVLFSGCESGQDVKPIQSLRSEGKFKEARELALTVLAESPKSKLVWQELVRVDMDAFKKDRPQTKEPDRSGLFEASFITAAYLQKQGTSPSEAWKSLGIQLYSSLTAECTFLIGTMNQQKRLANYLHELISSKQDAYGSERSITATSNSVDEFRDQAAKLVSDLATSFALLEFLPENSPGTRNVLKLQIEKDINDWAATLDVEPSLQETIWDRSTQTVKKFLENAKSDWSDMGYLQISTVTQTKVQ